MLFRSQFFPVSKHGLVSLVEELYWGETWSGYTRHDKARDTGGEYPVRVYAFLPREETNMVSLKSTLRSLYHDRNAIHINDTHEETMRYATCFFNANSIEFLDRKGKLSSTNQETFNTFARCSRMFEMCIVSSFVMALYGIREARDLDYIHLKEPPIDTSLIHSHRSQEKYYKDSFEDILFHPKKHFYVHGVKVCTLDVLMEMKQTRQEDKDRVDCDLIKKIE